MPGRKAAESIPRKSLPSGRSARPPTRFSCQHFCWPALSCRHTPHHPSRATYPRSLLAQALASFARQTGLQIVYLSGVVREQRSPGAPAGLTPDAALTQLLAGTGLRFEYLNERSLRILPAPVPPHEKRTPERPCQRTAR